MRFETVPSELVEAIDNMADIPRLRQLLLQAIAISSLAEFQQLVERDSVKKNGGTNEISFD
jgi:hypothetical protein